MPEGGLRGLRAKLARSEVASSHSSRGCLRNTDKHIHTEQSETRNEPPTRDAKPGYKRGQHNATH